MGHHGHCWQWFPVCASSFRVRLISLADRHRLFGYDQGVMSGLLTGDAFVARFPEINTTKTGHGSSALQGTV